MIACLKALKERHNVELLVFRWPVAKDAPFDERKALSWIDALYTKRDQNAEDILQIVKAFQPQGILIPGWMDREYLKVARELKKMNVPVVAGSDTPWVGTLRQWGGKLMASRLLHTSIDVLWVAGERQRSLARHFGFTGRYCWSGLYTCDWEHFARAYNERTANNSPSFLYAGRYTEDKGLDLLVEAYEKYRSLVRKPWPLICAGTGALQPVLSGRKGIVDKGFVQPEYLPQLMHKAAAFVLPSRREPWGVVIHEAATAGLPLICSTACGASVSLLREHYNGFLFENKDVYHLTDCLLRMHKLSSSHRLQMGRKSHDLSRQYSPGQWADTFIEGLQSLRQGSDIRKQYKHQKSETARVVE